MPIIPTDNPEKFDYCEFWPIVQAVMHYPCVAAVGSDYEKKRQYLIYYYQAKLFQKHPDLDGEEGWFGPWHVRVAAGGKSVKELGDDQESIYKSALHAAQWLRFRLFASTNAPDHNSNGKSDYYAAHILPPRLQWKHLYRSEGRVLKARMTYGPVAHLWAACMDQPEFIEKLAQGMLRTPPLLAMASANILRMHRDQLLARAQAYFQAAVSAGVFGDGEGSIPLDQIWQLPGNIAPDAAVTFDTPDLTGERVPVEHLLEDYKIRSRY